MWWALFWGFVIAVIASNDRSGGGAGVVAFLVIWYFVNKSNEIFAAGTRVEKELIEKVDDSKTTETSESPQKIEKEIEDLEQQAGDTKREALQDHLNNGREAQIFCLRRTEDDYINLKSRLWQPYRLQLARDWLTYTKAIARLSYVQDMLTVDDGSRSDDLFDERYKVHKERQNVEQSFQEMYGKQFVDRWKEWESKKTAR